MLTRRADAPDAFTRRDGTRLGIAGAILALVLTAVLGIDVALPQGLAADRGPARAPRHRRSRRPRFRERDQDRGGARGGTRAVPDQYDYTTGNAIAIAAAQQRAFESRVDALDAAFAADISPEDRAALLDSALVELDLPEAEAETLRTMERARWRAVRTEAARVLDVTMRFEVRDSEVESTQAAPSRTRWPATSTTTSGSSRPRSSPR